MAPTRLRSCLLVLALIAAGCGAQSGVSPSVSTPTAGGTGSPSSPGPSPVAYPLTVTDDEGTSITLPAKPARIVSLTPATTETLFALGAGPRVVGKVEDIAGCLVPAGGAAVCGYPPEAAGVPVVATFSGVDVEKIVALQPDLVVSGGAGLTQGDAVEQLRRAKVPVLVSYPTSIAEALAGIRLIGTAIGSGTEGGQLA